MFNVVLLYAVPFDVGDVAVKTVTNGLKGYLLPSCGDVMPYGVFISRLARVLLPKSLELVADLL